QERFLEAGAEAVDVLAKGAERRVGQVIVVEDYPVTRQRGVVGGDLGPADQAAIDRVGHGQSDRCAGPGQVLDEEDVVDARRFQDGSAAGVEDGSFAGQGQLALDQAGDDRVLQQRSAGLCPQRRDGGGGVEVGGRGTHTFAEVGDIREVGDQVR